MTNWEFLHPEWLWLLLVIPLLAVWFFWRRHEAAPTLSYPGAEALARHAANWPARLWWLPSALRLAAIALVIMALARPRTAEENVKSQEARGIDIVMSIDVSASMLAQDFEPNRLKVTKEITAQFIKDRPRDRIGIVAFAGESYTQTPLTSDQDILLNNLHNLQNGLVKDGTAIGMGLATAVSRLKDSRTESKVIILLSDGENNTGRVSPATAISLAQEYGIRVYTIGVGSKGKARMPVAYDASGGFRYAYVPVEIDEKLLTKIAHTTGGQYFRATDGGKLQSIYQEIDKLEKTKIKEEKFYTYTEKFTGLALAALCLFVLELVLRYTLLKSFV